MTINNGAPGEPSLTRAGTWLIAKTVPSGTPEYEKAFLSVFSDKKAELSWCSSMLLQGVGLADSAVQVFVGGDEVLEVAGQVAVVGRHVDEAVAGEVEE